MTQEELEKKQSELAMLAVEISRLRKLIGLKQLAFNKLDNELYLYFKNQIPVQNAENGQESTSQDN